MIKLARKRQDARARDEAISRFDREHAAKGSRADDRSVGLAAERERDHMRCHRRRRSRRRAARRARVIVRIARGASMEIGELGGYRLADDDRPGGAQLRHYRGVVAGPTTGGERRAALGRVIRRLDDVLDRDRNAVQRPERMAVRAPLIEATRLRERMVTIEMRERLDLAVEPFNALE